MAPTNAVAVISPVRDAASEVIDYRHQNRMRQSTKSRREIDRTAPVIVIADCRYQTGSTNRPDRAADR